MSLQDQEKRVAAARAVEFVQDGMRVGLGTGSTAAHAVALLGERVRGGLSIVGLPTSERTREQALAEGIPLVSFQDLRCLDVTIDGADEADRQLRLIKGGGGALLREKIVASASDQMIVIADSSKCVDDLGAFPLPVEVVPFAAPLILSRLEALELRPSLRLGPGGKPYVTDERNHILDCATGPILDPEALASTLDAMPGVVEHGLFIGLATTLVVGRGGRAEVIGG